jgi:MFS transporter, BCD family, chlorophyll transporter
MVGTGHAGHTNRGHGIGARFGQDDKRPRVVALLYSMLLVGMIASSAVYGWCLVTSAPKELIPVWCKAAP